jgi:hypothetical protein
MITISLSLPFALLASLAYAYIPQLQRSQPPLTTELSSHGIREIIVGAHVTEKEKLAGFVLCLLNGDLGGTW